MSDHLTPEQTQEFRGGQKKRSRIILLVIVFWVALIFALTMVKGQIAVEHRESLQQETHE